MSEANHRCMNCGQEPWPPQAPARGEALWFVESPAQWGAGNPYAIEWFVRREPADGRKPQICVDKQEAIAVCNALNGLAAMPAMGVPGLEEEVCALYRRLSEAETLIRELAKFRMGSGFYCDWCMGPAPSADNIQHKAECPQRRAAEYLHVFSVEAPPQPPETNNDR